MPSNPTPSTLPLTSAMSACHLLQCQKGSPSRSCHGVDTSQLEPRSSRCNQAPGIHISLQHLGGQSLAKVLEGGKKSIKLTCCSQFIRCSSFGNPDKTRFHHHFKTLHLPRFQASGCVPRQGLGRVQLTACCHTLATCTSVYCFLSDRAALSNDALGSLSNTVRMHFPV